MANPLRSISGDAAYDRDVITGIGTPVVLFGHFHGGMVITETAADNDAVLGVRRRWIESRPRADIYHIMEEEKGNPTGDGKFLSGLRSLLGAVEAIEGDPRTDRTTGLVTNRVGSAR